MTIESWGLCCPTSMSLDDRGKSTRESTLAEKENKGQSQTAQSFSSTNLESPDETLPPLPDSFSGADAQKLGGTGSWYPENAGPRKYRKRVVKWVCEPDSDTYTLGGYEYEDVPVSPNREDP